MLSFCIPDAEPPQQTCATSSPLRLNTPLPLEPGEAGRWNWILFPGKVQFSPSIEPAVTTKGPEPDILPGCPTEIIGSCCFSFFESAILTGTKSIFIFVLNKATSPLRDGSPSP